METEGTSTAPAAPAAGVVTANPATTEVGTSTPATPKVTSSADPAPTSNWSDSFDPDLKEYVSSKGFQDPKSVLESYRNLEKLRGVPADRLLKLPDQPDAPEWKDVYSKLGTPATPEGYEFQKNADGDNSFTDWASENFHKLNLTKSQGQELAKQYNDFVTAQQNEQAEQHNVQTQEQTVKLKKEWGAAYNQNVMKAQAAYRTFGIPDAAVTALEKSMGFDGTMKFMFDIGLRLGEHAFVGGGNSQSFGDNQIFTPSQAKAKIAALKSDTDFSARYLKGDTKAREQLTRLHEMAAASD